MLLSTLKQISIESVKNTGSLNAFGKAIFSQIAKESGISKKHASENGLDWFLAIKFPVLLKYLKDKGLSNKIINVTVKFVNNDYRFVLSKSAD